MRVRALVSVVIMVSDTWIERSINTHELVIQMLHSLLSLLLRHFTVGNVTKTSEEVKAYILRQSHHVFHSDVNQVRTFCRTLVMDVCNHREDKTRFCDKFIDRGPCLGYFIEIVTLDAALWLSSRKRNIESTAIGEDEHQMITIDCDA